MRTFTPFQFVSVRYLFYQNQETLEEEKRERAGKPRHKPKKEERQVAGSRRSAYQVAEKEVVLFFSIRSSEKKEDQRTFLLLNSRGSQMHFAGRRRVARHGG